MDCSRSSSEGSEFNDLGTSDSLEELSLLNGNKAYIVYCINGLTFGFLHSLEGFVLDLIRLILPETILVIKKAYARALPSWPL